MHPQDDAVAERERSYRLDALEIDCFQFAATPERILAYRCFRTMDADRGQRVAIIECFIAYGFHRFGKGDG